MSRKFDRRVRNWSDGYFAIVPQRPNSHANRRVRSTLSLCRDASRSEADHHYSPLHGFLNGERANTFAATCAASEPCPVGT